MNAPQTLPAPQRATDARWTTRLSKTQRAVLRTLYGRHHGGLTLRELHDRISRQIEQPGVDIALTRLLSMGFVKLGGHRVEYMLTGDGRRRAEMTRPRLPGTYTEEEKLAAARAAAQHVRGIR